jgi:hypothetical protein
MPLENSTLKAPERRVSPSFHDSCGLSGIYRATTEPRLDTNWVFLYKDELIQGIVASGRSSVVES